MTTYLRMTRRPSVEERFEHWMEAHPEIYAEFKRIAGDLRTRGIAHYGAKAIMEVIRFHRAMSGQDESNPFKIDNNFTSLIARKLISEDAHFANFFELRELRSR